MTYEQFEEKLYTLFTQLAEERGWYFALRKGYKPKLFRGTERSGYTATSFWEMTSTAGIKHVPTIALILFTSGDQCGYRWEIRQIRSPTDDKNKATLELVKSILAKNQWRADRVSNSKASSKFFDVVIKSQPAILDDFTTFRDRLVDELERFIPEVDTSIATVREQLPELDARRLTADDLAAGIQHFNKNKSRAQEKRDLLEFEPETILAVDEWLAILENESITRLEDRKILRAFLKQVGHRARAVDIDAILNPERSNPKPGGVNGAMAAFSARIEDHDDYEIVRHESKDSTKGYFNLLFEVEKQSEGWMLTLKPNLVTALNLIAGATASVPLNQILYGPPGTGKTYATIAKAVAIANPDFDLNQDRTLVQAEYERLRKEGRIIFTTFHQSLSYEDFVEGLKPGITEEETINYKVAPGVFRTLVARSYISAEQTNQKSTIADSLNFTEQYDSFLQHLEEFLETKDRFSIERKRGGDIYITNVSGNGRIDVNHGGETDRVHTIRREKVMEYNAAVAEYENNYREAWNSINASNHTAYWAVWNAVRNFKPVEEPVKRTTIGLSGTELVQMVKSIKKVDFSNAPNYVLIIDEINRGNVSRIFGELITLLEPDKRLGRKEALTVTLPYSRDTFGVPPNLYIIGTMNTADRSVVALDSALRRRFRFVEIAPDPEVLTQDGRTGEVSINGTTFYLKEIMTAINNRIEFLRDRDHLIGHSYFLKMKTVADVAEQFATGIIPLLREYFYEDYGQLRLILGDGFIHEKKQKKDKKLVSLPTGIKDNDLGLKEYRKYTVESFVDENGQLYEGKLAAGLDVLLGEKKQEE